MKRIPAWFAIGEVAVQSAIRDSVVVLVVPQVELADHGQPGGCRRPLKDREQLGLDPRVSSRRRGVHMPHTLPDLVEQVLPEATPPLKHRLEFRWLWVTDERRHVLKATGGSPAPIPIAHASPITSFTCDRR